MNSQDFDKIVANRIEKIKSVLSSKAKEYAKGDRLYNFKRAAEIERVTTEKALLGMWTKHIVSVLDLIEGSLAATEYMVNEKIGDAINYLILLEAVLTENETNMNVKLKDAFVKVAERKKNAKLGRPVGSVKRNKSK